MDIEIYLHQLDNKNLIEKIEAGNYACADECERDFRQIFRARGDSSIQWIERSQTDGGSQRLDIYYGAAADENH